MTDDTAALYRAYVSRDARFDGVFFVGVTSTGIYCRPVCTARTPRATNCRFFTSAAAAEKASFRPCLRCRPELAPGSAPVDGTRRVAARIAHRISEGLLDDGSGLERLAAEFHFSPRQIRRIVRRELGVSPIDLVQTRRLLLAKQLLTDTSLPVSTIAHASGFSSLRRFNDAFRTRYGMPPTRLRGARPDAGGTAPATLVLRLGYRTPFDWRGMLAFLGGRALAGVERIGSGAYLRTLRLGEHRGWIRVGDAPEVRALSVELALGLAPVLPALLARLRQMFDLGARPDLVAAVLGRDPRLAASVAANPGLRVPGACDGFELAVRAVLGQQVSVKAATTLAGRFAAAFGDEIATPHEGLTRLSPTAERIAAAAVDEIAGLGIVRTRARTLVALGSEVASGRLRLEPGADPEETMARLVALPGIGPWTAHYVAMRALRWPDAFPKEDVALRKRLGAVGVAEAEALSRPWRPWRSYATLHLWGQPPS